MKLSLSNSHTIYHLALGLGICGICFYLAHGTEPNLINIG